MKDVFEIPQCPICQDPFIAGTKLVVVQRCGHVLCKDCAQKHFVAYRQKECPMCRTEAKRSDLIDLYLSYGEHSVETLTATKTSKGEDDEIITNPEEVTDSEDDLQLDKSSIKARKIISSLKELTHSEPRTWKGPKKPTDEDLGLRILQTGAFIRDLAEKVKPTSGRTADLLVKLGSAVSDLHIIIRKVIALAHDYESLQDRLNHYDAETEAKVSEYQKEINILTRKISTSSREHREKEMSLKQRLHKAQEELAAEKSVRQSMLSNLATKDKEVTTISKKHSTLQKKFFALKQELEKCQNSKASRRHASQERESDASLSFDDQSTHEPVHHLDDDMHESIPLPSSSTPLSQDTDSGLSQPSLQVLESCSPPSSHFPLPSGSSTTQKRSKPSKPKPSSHSSLVRSRETRTVTKSDKHLTTRHAGVNPYSSLSSHPSRSKASAKPPSNSGASYVLSMPVPSRRDHHGEASRKRTRPNFDGVDIG